MKYTICLWLLIATAAFCHARTPDTHQYTVSCYGTSYAVGLRTCSYSPRAMADYSLTIRDPEPRTLEINYLEAGKLRKIFSGAALSLANTTCPNTKSRIKAADISAGQEENITLYMISGTDAEGTYFILTDSRQSEDRNGIFIEFREPEQLECFASCFDLTVYNDFVNHSRADIKRQNDMGRRLLKK